MKYLYVIYEGECKLYSTVNPQSVTVTADGQIVKRKMKEKESGQQGFHSQTTNNFQLVLKGPLQWLCEESLITKPEERINYSVVAVNKVTCFQVSKHDMLTKFNFNFVANLKSQAL
jgi:hypothetical protein